MSVGRDVARDLQAVPRHAGHAAGCAQKIHLVDAPRRMPSMAAGYGLEIAGYISKENL